jgi:large subunit ribosomal protein L19
MTDILREAEKVSLRSDRPSFSPGDSVRVHVKVKEGEKERIQIFAGIVIARRGGGSRETFTVRKISGGVGVERVFPLHSPMIERVDVDRRGDVRRSEAVLRRELKGKAARVRKNAPIERSGAIRDMGGGAALRARTALVSHRSGKLAVPEGIPPHRRHG